MDLRISDIQKDIVEYQQRISEAREKLAALPVGHLPYVEHKKRVLLCRGLQDDIKHYTQLIIYTNEGLESLKTGV